ncbi:MAG TPA: circadian clock protein KaiC [Pyrinomonadaceae bacterium]
MPASQQSLSKSPTGIEGFDQITGGGLPTGRPTLVCGSAGCGKTLFAMEFLIHGAVEYKEPGVFVAFEETAEDLAQNVLSLGFDLKDLIAKKKLEVDHIHIERSEIEETGEYDLDGLFVRLAYAIDSVKAKRIVLDTLEALFASLPNEGILRAELRRLFRWLKDRGVTAVITAERGAGTLTRHGLEEYVSDCVILLDHRVTDQLSTRRLRVVKYRGSSHGTNEYPFLIDEKGISVMPVTSLGLEHKATTQRVSTGVPQLDDMLGGEGVYRGSSVLVSGTAGTGKSSLAAHFTRAACQRGERCLYFAFEESMSQILRNMRSIGIDLRPWVKKGLLQFSASRPTAFGLEMHVAKMHKLIEEFRPDAVVVDPLTNLITIGNENEVRSALLRLIDLLKLRQITGFFTSLTHDGAVLETTDLGVSSLMDTWILLRDMEINGERNRGLYVLKSRGIAHSNQIREFHLTNHGIELIPAYLGPAGVLTGSSRHAQESRELADAVAREQEIQRKQRELQRKRQVLEAQITGLRATFESEEDELRRTIEQGRIRETQLSEDRDVMARLRQARASYSGDDGKQTNGAGDRHEGNPQKETGKKRKAKRG